MIPCYEDAASDMVLSVMNGPWIRLVINPSDLWGNNDHSEGVDLLPQQWGTRLELVSVSGSDLTKPDPLPIPLTSNGGILRSCLKSAKE